MTEKTDKSEFNDIKVLGNLGTIVAAIAENSNFDDTKPLNAMFPDNDQHTVKYQGTAKCECMLPTSNDEDALRYCLDDRVVCKYKGPVVMPGMSEQYICEWTPYSAEKSNTD